MRFILILLFFPFHLLAQKNMPLPQDISGVWAGYMYNDITRLNNDFQLAISGNSGKLSGYSYTIFIIDGRKNIGIKTVKVKEKNDLLFVEDDHLINDNYDARPAKGVRTFIELHYSENDTADILSGTWKTNITRQYNSLTGTLFLERKKKPEETAIILKLRQLHLSDQLSFLPKSDAAPQKSSSITAKLAEDSKKIAVAEKTAPRENTAGLIKKEEQIVESKKIIPDTTITNPEITIFMFPKSDLPAKDGVKVVERNDVVLNEKAKTSLNPDSLRLAVSKKEQVGKEVKTVSSKNLKITTGQNTNPIEEIAKTIVPSIVEKTAVPDPKILVITKDKTKENPSSANKKIKEIDTHNKTDQDVVKQKIPAINAQKTVVKSTVGNDKIISAEMLSERKIETIRTVEYKRDTLVFSLFDNGVIDGDTVSVLLNGEVIMSRIGLHARGYNDTIYLSPEMGDSINIILYAENLGSIAPNTGMLVVRDGETDHEIRFSGDLKKNSAIILKRKRLLNEH